jgi:hypothetical protein
VPQLLVADLYAPEPVGGVEVAGQYEAWLQADEFERLAEVIDKVTSFHNAHRILAPRVYAHVDDIENTNDEGTVEIELVPDPESDSPYYALLYGAPSSDPRGAFMFASENLRELAARIRAVDDDQLTDTVVVTLDTVDDGTWDSDIHPQFEVQKKPDITGQPQVVAHLWFDHLERFP